MSKKFLGNPNTSKDELLIIKIPLKMCRETAKIKNNNVKVLVDGAHTFTYIKFTTLFLVCRKGNSVRD
jgi:hypothetical protein